MAALRRGHRALPSTPSWPASVQAIHALLRGQKERRGWPGQVPGHDAERSVQTKCVSLEENRPTAVMAGLRAGHPRLASTPSWPRSVAAIHALLRGQTERRGWPGQVPGHDAERARKQNSFRWKKMDPPPSWPAFVPAIHVLSPSPSWPRSVVAIHALPPTPSWPASVPASTSCLPLRHGRAPSRPSTPCRPLRHGRPPCRPSTPCPLSVMAALRRGHHALRPLDMAGLRAGHPRLTPRPERKAWMAGTSARP